MLTMEIEEANVVMQKLEERKSIFHASMEKKISFETASD